MLTSLHIQNYALIEDLTAPFPNGLVILTGETGAGKSIIIDALGLVIGERASVEGVRAGAERAVVEAVFDTVGKREAQRVPPVQRHGSRRRAHRPPRDLPPRARAAASSTIPPSPSTVLKQIGEFLVDLHGQHEHQSLLRPETHVTMLDDFGGLEDMVREYQEALGRLRSTAAELGDLRKREQQLREKREFTAFQLRRSMRWRLAAGEEGELQEALTILENAERLFSTTGALYEAALRGGTFRPRPARSRAQPAA